MTYWDDDIVACLRTAAGGNECSYFARAADMIDHLRELLRVEEQLALRKDPFKCQDIECEWYGRAVRAGDCQCHTMQAQEHRVRVRDALKPNPTGHAPARSAAEGR